MPTQYIRRGSAPAPGQVNKANANLVYVDTDTNTLKFGAAATGTTEKEAADLSSNQTITGVKTFSALPLITADGGLQYAEVALTNAEIKALRATPKTLVAAPGAGKILYFYGAVLILDYGGTNVFTETDDNLAVRYTDGSGVIVSQAIETTGFIDQSADTMTTAESKIDVIAAKTASENKALVLHNTGDGEIGGNAGNDNLMRVRIFYAVVSSGW